MSNEKNVINPLKGYAKQSAGELHRNGIAVLHFCHQTEDARLWGHLIPKDVDAEKYLQNYSMLLNASAKEEIAGQNKAEMVSVVRSKNREITGNDKVANFDVFPIQKICYLDRYGINIAEKERIQCKIVFDGGKEEGFEILTSDIAKIAKKITEKYSTAVINFSEPNADKIMEANFRFRTQYIAITKRLFEAGWQRVNGEYRYISDSAISLPNYEIATGLFLPCYGNLLAKDIGNIFLRAIKMYKEEQTAHTVFLFSLLGVLFKPFEEAGYEPHFLLFMNGKTGSLKTTIAKILFTQLSDLKHRKNPRRIDTDTLTSFERAVVLSGRDTTLLIDDYAPAKTPQKKADMQNRLEMLIRMIGDGSTKSRSNAKLEDIQGEGVKGTVVVTGEIKGNGVSSNLRCLYCTVKRGYANLENITWFQQNEYAYTSAILHFTDYLSWNWDGIVDLIIKRFPAEREAISKTLSEKRLIDSAVILRITADIFEKFMREYCDIDKFFIAELIKSMRESVVLNACANEAMAKEESFGQLFIRAINTLMAVNKIRLYSGKMEAEHIKVYDGFEDGEYYYFIPETVYIKTKQFMGSVQQFCPYDLKELVTSMYEDGIIKAHSNGCGKKTYYARVAVGENKKEKFLKISKKVFQSIVDETFDNEEGGY